MESKHIKSLLRPVVKLCFEQALGLHDLVEALKIVLIEVAEAELKKSSQKISVSRLSIMTGVHRKDAEKIYNQGHFEANSTRLSGKVIAQWRGDKRFQGKNGRPRVLSFLGEDSEFAALVATVSAELKSGTILFDLERIGAVKRTNAGLKLIARSYMPRGDWNEGIRMLAGDSTDMIEAVIENIRSSSGYLPNYHAKGSCDNLSADDLPKIEQWFLKSCGNFHERAMRYLSQFDLDLTPQKGKVGGSRFAVGIFTHSQPAKDLKKEAQPDSASKTPIEARKRSRKPA